MIFQLWQFYIIILFEGPTLSTGYIPNCTALKPVKDYCPPYDTSQWKLRAYCKNCKDDQKYHCCKDYDSPKLNCQQGDVYCKDELYVEGCAEEKFCKIGEEPVLSFIENQVRVENPEVFCVLCYNNNLYNSAKNKSSATYSECPERKKNICTQDTHKIECGKSSSEISDRFCRCDSENGYFPYSDPDDHPIDGCSYFNYFCEIGRCEPNERMLLNYTCVCKEGYNRPNSSAKCSSIHTKESTLFTQSSTKIMLPSSITTTTESIVTSTEKTTALIISIQDSNTSIYTSIVIAIGIIAILFVTVVVLFANKIRCRKSNEMEEEPQAQVTAIDDIETIGDVTSDDEFSPFISTSTLPLSEYTKGSYATLSSIKENADGNFTTNPLDRSRYRNEPNDIEYSFNSEEYRDFVRRVLQTSLTHMIDFLEPDYVLDKLEEKEVFSQSVLKDIRDERKRTEKTRQILEKVKSNCKCYQAFKDSLKDTKQTGCLDKLELQERIIYTEIITARKEKKPSGGELSENEHLNKSNETHLQSRTHTYSTSSTGFDFKIDDESPPHNKILYRNKSEIFVVTSADHSNESYDHIVNINERRLEHEPGDEQKDGQTDQESDGTSEETN